MPQSANTLSPAPITQPVLGPGGLLTTPWTLFFQKLLVRVGGGSTDPLDQTNTSLGTLQTGVTALQTTVTGQTAAIAAVQGEQTADHAALQGLETALGLAAGTWVPTFTGATVTGAATAAGTWTATGSEVFWEVLLDATAGSYAFAAATIGNMPVAAVRAGVLSAVSVSTYADHGQGYVQGTMARLPDFTVSGGVAVLAGRYSR